LQQHPQPQLQRATAQALLRVLMMLSSSIRCKRLSFNTTFVELKPFYGSVSVWGKSKNKNFTALKKKKLKKAFQ